MSITEEPATVTHHNPLPALDSASRRALRESIKRFGAGLVPCLRDQYGETVDGHNRETIAADLGCEDTLRYVDVELPDEPAERAAALLAINDARRQRMDAAQRREVVKVLREAGHSTRAIAEAVGVDDKTVRTDLQGADHSAPETVVGQDGKRYAARKPLDAAPPTTNDGILTKADKEAENGQDIKGYHYRTTSSTLNSLRVVAKSLAKLDFEDAVRARAVRRTSRLGGSY